MLKKVICALMKLLERSYTVEIDGKPIGYIVSLKGENFPCSFMPISRENCQSSENNSEQLITPTQEDSAKGLRNC